ncbi:MAG: PDZ domain-containing protein [Planctomycetia bacterium]|nr:PDZ domain-containing protein [Planctomycetia bacterium]
MPVRYRLLWGIVLFAGPMLAASPATAQPPAEPMAPAQDLRPGYLGVLAADSGDGAGAVMAEVVAGSPAAQADLRSGDVVVAVDGQPVEGASSFITAMAQVGPGESSVLTVRHAGFSREVSVTLGARPAPERRRFPEFGQVQWPAPMANWATLPRPDSLLPDRTPPEQRLGLHTQPSNPAALARRRLPERAGVLVSRVERDSPADLAGITVGTLIVSVDGVAVESRQALSKAIAGSGDTIEVTYFAGAEERSGTLVRTE